MPHPPPPYIQFLRTPLCWLCSCDIKMCWLCSCDIKMCWLCSCDIKMCWLCSCDIKMCWLCSCDIKMCWLCSCDIKMCWLCSCDIQRAVHTTPRIVLEVISYISKAGVCGFGNGKSMRGSRQSDTPWRYAPLQVSKWECFEVPMPQFSDAHKDLNEHTLPTSSKKAEAVGTSHTPICG